MIWEKQAKNYKNKSERIVDKNKGIKTIIKNHYGTLKARKKNKIHCHNYYHKHKLVEKNNRSSTKTDKKNTK